MEQSVRKIVILFPEFLGDFLMLVPFIHALKVCVPNSSIDIYSTEVVEKMALYHPAINETFTCPTLIENGKLQWRRVWRFSKELKQKGYDIAYFTNDHMFWPLWLAGIDTIIQEHRSVGFRLLCKGTPHSKLRDNLRHAAERHVHNLTSVFNVVFEDQDLNFSLNIPNALLESKYIPSSQYVFLNADGNSAKKYHGKLYKQVCDYVIGKGYKVVIGGVTDKCGLEMYQGHPQVEYLVGKTTFYEFLGLIRSCDLVISVDSGPSHIACMYQKRSFVFHPAKANFPFKTAGYYRLNWSYKLSPSESHCDLKCSFFQGCPESFCETDYVLDDIYSGIDRALTSDRSWVDKKHERYQKSVGIGLLFPEKMTEIQRVWIHTMKQKGYFIFVKEYCSLKTLKWEAMHTLIKQHRLHVIVCDVDRLPLKIRLWNWWYRFSERAYVTFLSKLSYEEQDESWFNKVVEALKN